jgi:hypothetical protein
LYCGKDGKGEQEYLIQTVSSPKQYFPIMGGTAVYIEQKQILGK